MDGYRLSSTTDLQHTVLLSEGRPVKLKGWRDNELFTTTVIPQPIRLVDSFFCRIGFVYLIDGTIIYIQPDSPADNSELEPADMIVTVDGLAFPSHRLEIDQDCETGSLLLEVYRDHETTDLRVEYAAGEISDAQYNPFGFFYNDEGLITSVIPRDIASEAGLEEGDIILGGITETWIETPEGGSSQGPGDTILEYERDGSNYKAKLKPDNAFARIQVLMDNAASPVLVNLPYNHRLTQAGMASGDEILSIDGVPTPNGISTYLAFTHHPGELIDIVALSDNEERIFTVPIPKGDNPEESADFFKGLHFKTQYFPADPESSLVAGIRKSQEISGFIFKTIGWLISGKASVKDLAGPVGIVSYTYQAASSGLVDLIHIMVLLSVNLAIFNLLPFPALDGGRILFMIPEIFLRRPIVNVRLENIIHIAGFLLLILLALFVTYHDIAKLIFGG